MIRGAKASLFSGTPQIGGLLNFRRSSLLNWKVARDNARSGKSNGVILALGDSTTVGFGSQGASFVNMKSGSWSTQLAAALSAGGVLSASQNCFCDFGYTTNAPTYDPRLSVASWTLNSGVQAMAGQTWSASSAAGNLSFTPSVQTDTCDIYYVTNTTTGSFNANVNGGTNTLVNSGVAAGYGKLTISGSLGSNTYNVAFASGASVFIVGFNAYNSAAKQISVLNFGQGGATSAQILNNVWASPNALIGVLAPALTIVQLGINDWLQGTGNSGLSSNVQTLITAAKPSGDVLLLTPIQGSPANEPFVTQQPYLDVYPQLALANNEVMLDVNRRWGGFLTANNNGFYYADGTHGSLSGYADEAAALAKILMVV